MPWAFRVAGDERRLISLWVRLESSIFGLLGCLGERRLQGRCLLHWSQVTIACVLCVVKVAAR